MAAIVAGYPETQAVFFPNRRLGAGFNLRPGHPDTTYLCVVDEARNVVS